MKVRSLYLSEESDETLVRAARAAGVSASRLADWLLGQGSATSLARAYVTARMATITTIDESKGGE